VASGLADSTWVTAVASGGVRPALKRLLSNDNVLADVNAPSGYLRGAKVSFATPTAGKCSVSVVVIPSRKVFFRNVSRG
jgi:hypothetical protein